MSDWTNLSFANVATTSPAAHNASLAWSDALARGGAAEFDGEAEKNGMLPLRKPPLDYFRVGLKMFALALAQQSYFVPLLGLFGQKREVM